MFGGEGGDARPSNEDEKCGRGDCAQNDVVLRNVGGGQEGSGTVCGRNLRVHLSIESPHYMSIDNQGGLKNLRKGRGFCREFATGISKVGERLMRKGLSLGFVWVPGHVG